MTLAPSMLKALRAVRDGGHVTRAELLWLQSEFYINGNIQHSLTEKGWSELEDKDREDAK